MPRYGRWGQTEPLYDKYISYTPYQYGLLNPMRLKDADGNEVVAKTSEAQEMILNTLPKDIRAFVVFNEEGYIEREQLNSVECNSGNFEALKTLVNDNRIIEVSTGEGFKYNDANGLEQPKEFGKLIYDESFKDSYLGPGTGEVGFYGVTMVPGSLPETYNSTDNNIKIVVNSDLSQEGQATIFSHEAYGHAYLYLKDIDFIHRDKNGMESNEILYDRIIERKKETFLNMEEK
jgi:hypothetical protein